MKNRIIYKYPLPVTEGEFQLELPEHSQVLHLGVQDGDPFVWVAMTEYTTRTFHLRARWTGRPYNSDDEGRHLATLVLEAHGLVVHYFLLNETKNIPPVRANS